MPETLYNPAALEFVQKVKASQSHEIDMPARRKDNKFFSHPDVAAALHHLVYYSGLSSPVTIRFGMDGERFRFPLGHIPAPGRRNVNYPDLKIGLCSGRHAAMDPQVDFYLVDGNELNQRCSDRAQQAAFARLAAIKLLRNRLEDKVIHLVHTGLLSLVIGAYCGILELAIMGQRRYVVSRTLRNPSVKIAPSIASRLADPPFADYFEIEQKVNEWPLARWSPERPMNAAEHDELARFMGNQKALTLYNASQYGPIDNGGESIWG
jgi:hypothetical protein